MSEYLAARRGDADALKSLVRRHMPLVQSLAKRLSYSREDVFQAGCVGLVIAIRRFQPERGAQFSSYAVPFILGEMRRADGRGVGWRVRRAMRRAFAAREKYYAEYGREPPLEVLSRASGLDMYELSLLLETTKPPIYDENGALFSALPDRQGGAWLDRFLLRDLIERLPARDRALIHFRFILNRSQSELAHLSGAAQSTISRQEKRICRYLRSEWIG